MSVSTASTEDASSVLIASETRLANQNKHRIDNPLQQNDFNANYKYNARKKPSRQRNMTPWRHPADELFDEIYIKVFKNTDEAMAELRKLANTIGFK